MERWEPAARKLVGSRVRDQRELHRWTIERAAEAADLVRSYLAEIERGLRNPGLAVLLKLASALGCRVGDLVPAEAEALPVPRFP
jgi:transcriptional regulator with XRE-family HTH domain